MAAFEQRSRCVVRLVIAALAVVIAAPALGQSPSTRTLPTVQEMIAAPTDVWFEAAMRQPSGPNYEFFRDLLPPLRYVNTAFRHYPIMLSAPLSAGKARLISNGSAINARANKKPMWREIGSPVTFAVGDPPTTFGHKVENLDGPRYLQGYLPIVQMTYRHGGAAYEEEVFAPVERELADHGVLYVRFNLKGTSSGRIAARLSTSASLDVADGAIRDAKQQTLIVFDPDWHWDASSRTLATTFSQQRSAVMAVFTRPTTSSIARLSLKTYEEHRLACVKTWQELLARGTQLEVPEPLVNDAWRSLIVGNFMIAVGDRMNYSAGNAYDHLYESECGDSVRSLMLYGFTDEARRMVGPLLDFQRKATQFQVAGLKLTLLSHYYWVTRDAEYVRAKRPVWKPVADFILNNRDPSNGLMGRDNYAGDIAQQVFSLKSSALCWQGLRDIAAVLDDLGEKAEADSIAREARSLRTAILSAVEKSEWRKTSPPFIPMALLADEMPYDPITATRMGSYYNLITPYVIGTGIFGYGSPREEWLMGYLQQHGGIAMGMIRCQPHQGEFDKEPGLDDLYGIRYTLAQLRRDEREQALVTFYGKLAQGLTRDTFIGGEGTRFRHGDQYGRSMYLPPNSTSNAMFLLTLRYLLIQDWDLNQDGKPDTLRLLYAIPSRWLKDGSSLKIERAPTMFGEISMEVESHLKAGEVVVRITAPPRSPDHVSLRLPLSSGWKAVSASIDSTALPLAKNATVDLTGRRGPFTLRVQVSPRQSD